MLITARQSACGLFINGAFMIALRKRVCQDSFEISLVFSLRLPHCRLALETCACVPSVSSRTNSTGNSTRSEGYPTGSSGTTSRRTKQSTPRLAVTSPAAARERTERSRSWPSVAPFLSTDSSSVITNHACCNGPSVSHSHRLRYA